MHAGINNASLWLSLQEREQVRGAKPVLLGSP
jgi:hypothetical protein